MNTHIRKFYLALAMAPLAACAMGQVRVNQVNSVGSDVSIKSSSVTYQKRPEACQGKSKYVTWSFIFNNPVPADSIVLSLLNHQGAIELRNLKNTGAMSYSTQSSEISYSYCAPEGWRHTYPVRFIETTSGSTTNMIALEVLVP
jgi:hypothetical protein